jgi:hypothetical protein
MIFSWLAAVLGVGALGSLLLVPPLEFGRRFHRMISFMALLLMAAGFAGGVLGGGLGGAAIAAASALVFVSQWSPVSWIRPALFMTVLLGMAAVLAGARFEPKAPLMTAAAWSLPANTIAAGMLLGSVTMGMMVGHWYLNVPGLDIKHLRRMTWLLAACIALRIAFGMGGIATAVPTDASLETSVWRAAGIRQAFFFWQRVAIGLVAPAVLVFMVDRTVRIRSTQSATGLLYIAGIFVLIGEMISRFLYMTAGIPQ